MVSVAQGKLGFSVNDSNTSKTDNIFDTTLRIRSCCYAGIHVIINSIIPSSNLVNKPSHLLHPSTPTRVTLISTGIEPRYSLK